MLEGNSVSFRFMIFFCETFCTSYFEFVTYSMNHVISKPCANRLISANNTRTIPFLFVIWILIHICLLYEIQNSFLHYIYTLNFHDIVWEFVFVSDVYGMYGTKSN